MHGAPTHAVKAGGSKCDSNGFTIQERGCPINWMLLPMGFSKALDAAANSVTPITAKPQRVFLAKRYFVPSSFTSATIAISSINVGTDLMQATVGDLPPEMFSEVAIGSCVWFILAQAGVEITVGVKNVAGGALTFQSAMMGYSADATNLG